MGSAARRRVYKVRCANSLWHQDGNEKLRPWGFYIHGCVDGFPRRVMYLAATSNKREATVTKLFIETTKRAGIPSHVRGDYGTENNGIECFMESVRGLHHRAYQRGKLLWQSLSYPIPYLETISVGPFTTSELSDSGAMFGKTALKCFGVFFLPRGRRTSQHEQQVASHRIIPCIPASHSKKSRRDEGWVE